MRTLSGYILTNILGWKIKGEFPVLKKSVVIFAPHTSYWDGFYGKLYLMQLGINYKFLSKKEFFYPTCWTSPWKKWRVLSPHRARKNTGRARS